MHNLKSVDVALPRGKMIVVTGLSGSGKSSLAFDTLYAEGQRRYVESLSSYARQFLGRLDKPEVDSIRGISPAVAIEQRVVSRSSRSTVGTSTEIYDYFKLLFARIGKTYSPVSGREVKRHTVTDVVDATQRLDVGQRFLVLAPLTSRDDRTLEQHIGVLIQQGFSRLLLNKEVLSLTDAQQKGLKWSDNAELVVDRLSHSTEEEQLNRLADSVSSAFYEGSGSCVIDVVDGERLPFSNRFELDGMHFEEPSVNFFSFNNPVGACRKCEGFGHVIGVDQDLVIPNPGLSIFEEAIAPWRGEKMKAWNQKLMYAAEESGISIHSPYSELTAEQQALVWKGNAHFEGLEAFFKFLEEQSYKIQYRVMLSRYRGRTLCPECNGTRLRGDARHVLIHGHHLIELVQMPVDALHMLMHSIPFNKQEATIAKHLLIEIKHRLSFLCDVGLGYLTLGRLSSTLSGGESQRINLATSLGSALVGSMYILDEPSIGLHSRDTGRLIEVLHALRDKGNTVVVVEHDEDIMRAADYLVDIGPGAGVHGGQVVFSGTPEELLKAENLTAQYLTGRKQIPTRKAPRKWTDRIRINAATEHNLQGVTATVPLRAMTVVTGVSGSGKSTLIGDIFYPALQRHIGVHSDKVGRFDGLEGDMDTIVEVNFVDQNPIGKSSRSNPVTYVKAYDEIRGLMASQPLAKSRGYKPAHFSFNVPGGRCDQCEGEGMVTIEMQFMADIKLTCDACKGRRFKDEILDIRHKDLSISDILRLSIDEALEFFDGDTSTEKKLRRKIQPLQDVGLGYMALGQASSTLSGGEAQRVKLASYLALGERAGHTLFIFDEPTTGLHVDDVGKLLDSFNALLSQGHSIVIIEHNLDIVKNADWVIDLGPDGGIGGGALVFEGTPEDLLLCEASHTAHYLAEKTTQPA